VSSAMASFISAVAWVPRAVAAPHPKVMLCSTCSDTSSRAVLDRPNQKFAMDDDELERIGRLARLRLDNAQMDLEAAEKLDADHGLADDEGWEE
jgi:periodic tryptophan protein 1